MPYENSNYGRLAPSSFQSYGTSFQPPQPIYGSSYDSTSNLGPSRAPIPPPRTYNYNSNLYNGVGYNRYLPGYNRSIYNGSYCSYYQPNSYGIGPSPYGMPLNSGSSFIEEAQESSREAFSSIESIVSAFSSINMMIESTYCALHSSFNAVLAVAENLSRLRLHIGQILSAFTFIRSIQWLCRKFLHVLGLKKFEPDSELAWKVAANQQSLENLTPTDKKRSWPVIMFFIAVYAGPFLMWKFINSIMRGGSSKDDWTKEKDTGQYYYALAKYNYQAQNPEEISFNAGDYLKLAPFSKQKDKNWPLVSNGRNVGIVPINYIDIKLNKSNDSKQSAKENLKEKTKCNPTNKPAQLFTPSKNDYQEKVTNTSLGSSLEGYSSNINTEKPSVFIDQTSVSHSDSSNTNTIKIDESRSDINGEMVK